MLELKNLKIFKKAGTIFQKNNKIQTTDDIFFNKKKEAEFKKNMTLKSLLCIALTNSLTYYSLSASSTDTKIQAPLASGFITMSIPLESYVPLSESMESVKLIGPNNETISNNVVIENITEKEVDFEDKQLPIYLIQISSIDAQKLVHYQNKLIRAYPTALQDISFNTAKGEPYEIKF